MKFISLTTMIMSAAVLVGIVKADSDTNPNGGPCAQNSKYECGRMAGYNGNMPFLFYCNINNIVEVVQNCHCIQCCSVIHGGVGDSGSVNCT
ncbi:uncharacterized protein F5147DRAFT_712807 [Suillus discolor]|uniref:Uncharacterized protein n=1 Tax=Suillus discolor TaxID=1912936 RepID=A0A9P7F0G8_9AGAM|nr:uncharacterized protein F5147DRAFT_712807 [Suillus discolor]KAG2098932.1 hypothetical protein F5147DRAFT_712807 [Suillus discolor]